MTTIARRALLVALLLLAMSTIVSAQDGTVRPVTIRPVPSEAVPQGDIYDTTPLFEFSFDDLPTSITYFNIVVDDDGTEVFNQWYAVSDICNEVQNISRPAQTCDVPTSTSLHPGIGDLDLTWTLSEYDENAETVTESGSYDFTIKAPEILGPTMFSDPSGSPAFELNGEGYFTFYRVFVLNSSNETVMDEWVEVDQYGVGCDPDCTHILDMTQAPLYTDGDYTVYMQGWDKTDLHSAWSEPFTLTADFEAPTSPSVLPVGMVNEFAYYEAAIVAAVAGTACGFDAEANSYACSSSNPTVVVSPYDHGTPLELRAMTDDFQFDYRPFPIMNATEWFNVVVEDTNGEIVNQWINTYTDERCFYLDDTVQGGFGDSNLCVISFEGLAPGDYEVSWASYNPGGISPYESFDLTMLSAAPAFDAQASQSQTQVDNGLILPWLEWESAYYPEWVRVIIKDADTNDVAHDEWIQILDLSDWAEYTFDIQVEDLLNGEVTTFYDLIFGQAACNVDFCQLSPAWYPSNGNYELTFITWANGVMSDESDPVTFAYDNVAPEITFPEEPMERVAMVTVEGSARPIYNFMVTEGTAWVNLVIEDDSNNELLNEWEQCEKVCETFGGEPYACQWQPELDLVPGDYTWSVRGWSSGDLGAYSADQMLTISDTALTGTATISPNSLEGPYSQFPTFEWDAVANASWHQLQVTNTADNTIVWDEWVYLPADECGETCTYNGAPFVEFLDGAYSWRVRVANAAAVSDWTASETFTVEGFETFIQPVSPDDEYVNEGITFYWTPFASTDWYNVELFLVDPEIEPELDELEPVFSQWFNENTLNSECKDLWADFSSLGRIPVPEDLPATYCEYSVPVEDLEPGFYVWRVNSWGPTYGNNIAIGDEALPFIIR